MLETRNPESSSWNPEFIVWNPESKTVLDYLHGRDKIGHTLVKDGKCWARWNKCENEIISMSRAWDKEKIWVPDRIRTYDLPNTGRALYPLELLGHTFFICNCTAPCWRSCRMFYSLVFRGVKRQRAKGKIVDIFSLGTLTNQGVMRYRWALTQCSWFAHFLSSTKVFMSHM